MRLCRAKTAHRLYALRAAYAEKIVAAFRSAVEWTMRRLRSLYLCYLSLDDPLVHTQVIAYLTGLAAAGHRIHLLTFETRRLTGRERREIRAHLSERGIRWHALRYHKQPTLPATVYDTVLGALYATGLVLRHDLEALHARSHVPAAMALIAQGLLRRRRPALIFDIRGLMAQEYVDAGRWSRGGVPYRLTMAVQRVAIRRADGIVVLTEAVRRQLFGPDHARGVYVIPCCADVDALAAANGVREQRRAELGIADTTVMVYVGKFGGWYMAAEMVDFFTVAKRSIPSLHFLILTQGERSEIERELARRRVCDDYTVMSTPPELLDGYLAAADFGISFIRPAPSKVSSSPTKMGEYLGAGLPVVCTSGVGDLDALITPDIGTLVSQHTLAGYRAAADQCVRLQADADTAERCRATARLELSLLEIGIPRYRHLYAYVASRARA
jgi:glycosyltransferase involved in cell wall biosynthesis